MKTNKVFNFESNSPLNKTSSVMNRVITVIQDFFSLTPPQNQLIPVKSVYHQESDLTPRQIAMVNLLSYGMHPDHGDLILDEAENWELDYDLLNPSNVAVHGKSVWIDAQD